MARWKIQQAAISYADRQILGPGDSLEDTQLEISTTYGTDTLALVGRLTAEAVDNGNASGEMSLPVCRDFGSIDAAMLAMIELQSWADAHPLGELTVSGFPGVPATTWSAALRSLSLRITLAQSGYRLVANFNFALT